MSNSALDNMNKIQAEIQKYEKEIKEEQINIGHCRRGTGDSKAEIARLQRLIDRRNKELKSEAASL